MSCKHQVGIQHYFSCDEEEKTRLEALISRIAVRNMSVNEIRVALEEFGSSCYELGYGDGY